MTADSGGRASSRRGHDACLPRRPANAKIEALRLAVVRAARPVGALEAVRDVAMFHRLTGTLEAALNAYANRMNAELRRRIRKMGLRRHEKKVMVVQ